jgi:hypothetical protein
LRDNEKITFSKVRFCVSFSSLWPCDKHFFLLSLVDTSVNYTPETKVIFDIPTAIQFFGDPTSARTIVGEKIADLCRRWNEKFSAHPEVSS